MKPEHAIELMHLLPDARLMVFVGGHGDYLGEATMPQRARAPELTAGFVEEFLDVVSDQAEARRPPAIASRRILPRIATPRRIFSGGT